MTTTALRRTAADKHDERRRELAESALITLGEMGYARASLREIAQNSEFTHGVVHYYFQDKLELIVYCVRHYKKTCVKRYDDVIAFSQTPEELLSSFAAKLEQTIVEEAAMHRLWYDMRSQSLFEERFREAVLQIEGALENMVWRVVCKYAELSNTEPAMDSRSAYGVLDGLFQQALLGYVCGREDALPTLRAQVFALMPVTLASAAA